MLALKNSKKIDKPKVIELYRRKDNHNEVMCIGTIIREDYIIGNKLFSKIKCEKPYNSMYVVGKIYTVYAGDVHDIRSPEFDL